MGEQLDERFDFGFEFLIAMCRAAFGKFKDVRRVFWHLMRISERSACVAVFGTTRGAR